MSVHFTSTLAIIEQTAEARLSSDVLQVKLVFNGTESIKSLSVPPSECWKDLSWYFDKYAVDDPYAVSSAEDIRTRVAKSHAQIFEDLELTRYDEGSGTESILWVDIIDSGSSASQFHQIPWEFLEGHTPWKNWGTVVVRRKVPSSSPETVPLSLEKTNFNILCVVARKHSYKHSGLESDIAYQNVAMPIVDAVGRHPSIKVYLSRPGTFQAFQEHLESMPEGFYDIIHFDLHGKLRGKNTECRPFLGFAPELPTKHGLNYIEASQVAQVLAAHKACAVTLNACYSAHGDAPYSNLARTFVQHGVPRVLGMSYTLVESAAPLLVSSLFRAALFDNMPFSLAVRACRRALANDQVRVCRFGKTVQLDDFLVPVLYYSGFDISMKLTEAKQAPRCEVLEADPNFWFAPFRHTDASASPPERSWRWRWRNGTSSSIGFAPRDLDILSIERKIFCSANSSRTLMLYGPAGTGKTSLLLYLADWWETTNFIFGNSYIDFDAEDALTSPQTVECILVKLVEDISRMSPTHPKDIEPEVPSLEKTLSMIRNTKHFIIFDHVEAAFYGKTSQKWCSGLPIFPPDGYEPLKYFVEELARDSGESIIIISTRRKDLPEKLLPGIEFGTYELSGLPLFASIEIGVKTLSSNRSEKPSTDDLAFIQHLVQLLDCNPGALEVVLPFLAKLKRSPEHLLRLLLNGSLFADSRELIRMEFPPSLFTNLGKLVYNEDRSLQNVILFTSQLWKRMPREPKMFDTYIVLAATDLNSEDLSVADNVDLFEVKELREKLRKPKLDPTLGHVCCTVSREVPQVMVDLGWWTLETETYYRVNPLLQIFLQRRRADLDFHQQSFTQLEEVVRAEVGRLLQCNIPPSLTTESFDRAFVVYHGLTRSWFPGLLTAHFNNIKDIVQKEFYNLIKALELAAHSLPLLDRCWPHELALFLASFSQIPGILSKTDQLLVNSSTERILEVYEIQVQKYNPPALPGQLLGITLGLFHHVASYYSVSKPFESWIKVVDKFLAVAERARAVHGPLSIVDERKRRNLLQGKGQQLKARGDLQAAKEIFRDNVNNALQLDVIDKEGPEGHSYHSECATRLAIYLSLPNLSDEERQQANRQARKATMNVIKLSDNLELSTFMEHSFFLRQDNDFTPWAELPRRPVIPRSGFETGYPELLEDLQVNRGHDESQRARRRAQKEADLERALQSIDTQEQIRCHRALANWAFMEKDFQKAEEHCKDLLKFRDALSPAAAEKANNMVLLCSVAKRIPKEAWNHDPETVGEYLDNITVDPPPEMKALTEQLSTLSSKSDLASKYRSQSRWKEAEALFKEVIETRKKVLGPEHPSTLSDMVNLASTYWDQGVLEDAQKLELQVIAARKKSLGAEHPDTISAMNNLASTLAKQGKKDEATELAKKVLEKRQSILGEEHTDTIAAMGNLAMMLRAQDKIDEAETMMRNVVEIRKRIHGEQHPYTILAMINLAATLDSQGHFDEAVKMFEVALQECEKALKPDHRLRLMAVTNLGHCYKSRGMFEEAEKTFQLGLQAFEKALGPNHASVLSVVTRLYNLYKAQGKLDEAEKMSRRGLQASGGAHASEHVGLYPSSKGVVEPKVADPRSASSSSRIAEFVASVLDLNPTTSDRNDRDSEVNSELPLG